MQETIQKHEQINSYVLSPTVASQRGTAIQLSLSHLIAGTVALGLSFWLTQLHIQQPYILLISLTVAGICGLLCTLNLQYGLYLLDLTLLRLAQRYAETNNDDSGNAIMMCRWPLSSLFLRVQEIEQRIQHYVTNDSLTTELREKALQQASETAALAERNRIARELHDSIKQQIFSISISAATAKKLWRSENSEDAREAVEDIQRSAKEAQVEMQALLQQLCSTPLEKTSLVESLHIQAQALGFRTDAQIHLDIGDLPENDRLLPGTQETIFRLVQEAFANIAKHARARTVWLKVHTTEQELHIEIRDDGRGFDSTNVQRGMGLNNLQERTKALHGRIEVSSYEGQGTTILINIPLLEALCSPAEEVNQRYKLARADELARNGYQLCTNASFLGLATGLIGIITFNHVWGLVALGGLVVAIYGYASGAYYRARVALSVGRESRVTLELGRYQYRVSLDMMRLTYLGVLYALNMARQPYTVASRGLFIGSFVCLVGLFQFSRWHNVRDTEHFYNLLSTQELCWELERRRQIFARSLTSWLIVSIIGLIFAHSLFVLPLLTSAQQNAYGIAVILLLIGAGLFSEYVQIQHWKQQLRKRVYNPSA